MGWGIGLMLGGEPLSDILNPEQPAGPLRILVVDDEPDVCWLMEFLLAEAGHQVKTANDVASGWELFQGATWDVVLSDRKMPLLDGRHLARLIKDTAPETPVVLVSGRIDGGVDKECPVDASVEKPFTIDQLMAAIAEAQGVAAGR